MIGSLISVSYVSYYAVPSEAMTRVAVVPGSLVATLFSSVFEPRCFGIAGPPRIAMHSFSQVAGIADGARSLAHSSLRPQILHIWLGAEFATQGAKVLQILAFGAFVNSLAFIPYCLLQGLGRPDLTAKFHLLEFPFYFAALWFLIPKMGVAGAALAYSLRLVAEELCDSLVCSRREVGSTSRWPL